MTRLEKHIHVVKTCKEFLENFDHPEEYIAQSISPGLIWFGYIGGDKDEEQLRDWRTFTSMLFDHIVEKNIAKATGYDTEIEIEIVE